MLQAAVFFFFHFFRNPVFFLQNFYTVLFYFVSKKTIAFIAAQEAVG